MNITIEGFIIGFLSCFCLLLVSGIFAVLAVHRHRERLGRTSSFRFSPIAPRDHFAADRFRRN